jgi:hypothetical protein
MAGRFVAWSSKIKDRNAHPIPFLADGPGTGKSRFLQELPASFRAFVLKSEQRYDQKFREAVDSALFINVTFGNGSKFSKAETVIEMETLLCFRIMYQIDNDGCDTYRSFFEKHKSDKITLSSFLKKLQTKFSCFVLGIDEVNMVHELDKNTFKYLLDILGEISCESKAFFVPIIAGTVIVPLQDYVTKSTHPPIHIPLPLLSFEACCEILKKTKWRLLEQVLGLLAA